MTSDILQVIDDALNGHGRPAGVAQRIAAALLLVTIFGALRSLLPVPILPYLFFIPSIAAGAFLFGSIAGLAAVVASALAAVYFFLPPDRGFAIQDFAQGLSVTLFVVITAGIALAGGHLRATMLTLRRTSRERDRINATLEERVATEVASRIRAEDALRQSQKMEAIGQLAGGIAHDINNQLAGIAGSLELIERGIAHGRTDKVPKYVGMAKEASDRAATLTHRLLAYSRRQALEPVVCDPAGVVRSTVEMLRRTLGKNIVILVRAGSEPWLLRVDRGQLDSAVLNLCLNARDAMPHGGTITVEIANRTYDAREARERDLPAGEYVLISVTDTGAGMDAATRERIFEPFFTTKPAGRGTGLGLSMVYGFARQSSGQVRAYSEPGAGTTVRLKLPRYDGPDMPAASPVVPGRAGGETVLVVDDEPAMRIVMEDALSGIGYNVLSATDGASALRILRTDAPVDLLVSDVGMPGMDGPQLAEAGRRVRPDLKVLFVTGYAAQGLSDALAQGMHVMTKPFLLDVLGTRVATILAERAIS